MEMKNVKDPIPFIEVQENGLYSKVNGILGLSKDAMKRKGWVIFQPACTIDRHFLPLSESLIVKWGAPDGRRFPTLGH